VNSNNEIQGYKLYPMLHFCRKFSSGVTTRPAPLRGCYRCGEPNHLVKDCPHHLDVRRLTVEQRKELIEDLMALKDAVEEEEVDPSPEEDFV